MGEEKKYVGSVKREVPTAKLLSVAFHKNGILGSINVIQQLFKIWIGCHLERNSVQTSQACLTSSARLSLSASFN